MQFLILLFLAFVSKTVASVSSANMSITVVVPCEVILYILLFAGGPFCRHHLLLSQPITRALVKHRTHLSLDSWYNYVVSSSGVNSGVPDLDVLLKLEMKRFEMFPADKRSLLKEHVQVQLGNILNGPEDLKEFASIANTIAEELGSCELFIEEHIASIITSICKQVCDNPMKLNVLFSCFEKLIVNHIKRKHDVKCVIVFLEMAIKALSNGVNVDRSTADSLLSLGGPLGVFCGTIILMVHFDFLEIPGIMLPSWCNTFPANLATSSSDARITWIARQIACHKELLNHLMSLDPSFARLVPLDLYAEVLAMQAPTMRGEIVFEYISWVPFDMRVTLAKLAVLKEGSFRELSDTDLGRLFLSLHLSVKAPRVILVESFDLLDGKKLASLSSDELENMFEIISHDRKNWGKDFIYALEFCWPYLTDRLKDHLKD